MEKIFENGISFTAVCPLSTKAMLAVLQRTMWKNVLFSVLSEKIINGDV